MNKITQQCASACYPARQRACHRSNTQGSSVSGQEQAQRREPPFSQRCEYSLGGAQLRGYPPSTPKNDHSAGRAYPRDLRARTLQASDHWHPPGASPTHAPPARAFHPTRALPKSISALPFSRRFSGSEKVGWAKSPEFFGPIYLLSSFVLFGSGPLYSTALAFPAPWVQ